MVLHAKRNLRFFTWLQKGRMRRLRDGFIKRGKMRLISRLHKYVSQHLGSEVSGLRFESRMQERKIAVSPKLQQKGGGAPFVQTSVLPNTRVRRSEEREAHVLRAP